MPRQHSLCKVRQRYFAFFWPVFLLQQMHLRRLLNSSLLARHSTSLSLSFSSLLGSFVAVEPPMRLFFLAGSGGPCSLLAASTSSAGSLNLSFSYSACQSGPYFSRKHESSIKSWSWALCNACNGDTQCYLVLYWHFTSHMEKITWTTAGQTPTV